MSWGNSDAHKVLCEVCMEHGYAVPSEKHKFYAEHYYKHKLDIMGELKRAQANYEAKSVGEKPPRPPKH